MFANMSNGGGGGDASPPAAPKPKPAPKNQPLEKVYQKKTQLEHILLRPDTYIGSVEKVQESMWLYDDEKETMVNRPIEYVPGLYKIFDEILVNAADNKQRDKRMDCIKIDINQESNTISVWNNGKGIPVAMHQDEKMYVPTMIFGHLLTSSNYNDEEDKVTGGRNGFGAKLCNIFSTKFVVETACKEYKRQFKQTWGANMTKASDPKVKEFCGEDFTRITFCPDLTKFKMDKLDDDIVGLMRRRAYDVAASSKGVKVMLNGKRVPVKNFKDYCELFLKDRDEDSGNTKVIYESPHERWEVAVTLSERGFQQMSFVNSIATTKGGRHVDYIADMIVKQLIEILKKKNKGGLSIKPFQVKNHMWIFINCLIVNPTFDSQTKENMTLQLKSFGSKCVLSEKFITQVTKSGIVEAVLSWAKFKEQTQLAKTSGKKMSKLKGIPKLEDANEAGTKNALQCTLILTEGDSAKTLAVSGLGVIGRDYYGVFPLRGKLLNVREATHKQILENVEINNLIKIIGLQYKKKYNSIDDMKTLRYGKVMIMTDQDQDGSHIKGLLINFIHYNWPELLRQNFLEEFITPIVKATKKNEELSFYSLPEFQEWKNNTPNQHTYRVKYYKGLGTSTSKEGKEYFRDMARHRIRFKYQNQQDDDHIVLAFSKKHVEGRKEWLTNFMVESKRRKELDMPDKYLYTKDTKEVSYTAFVNLELVLFSNADNIRSIPSLVDGLKPGQRKVMFTCFKRNDKREVKVAQLSGSVAEMSAYHHGEVSLCMTIVNLAQNFVGSNNINLLEPRGQFGTRIQGGKDSASPRYIFTKMSPITRLIFHPNDDALLKHEYDDNQRIEPVWYLPIIPMVLVNGADGIGTGWMTKIPNYDPRQIVRNIRKMLDGDEPEEMMPFYKNFKGTTEDAGDHRYVVSGEISQLGRDRIEITELPVGTWTQNYKENVLEPLLHGSEKAKAVIADYKEYNTDTTVRFLVTLLPEMMESLSKEGLHKVFKLQSVITTGSMCVFDELGCIRRFDSPLDILKEYYTLRLSYYQKRKDYMEGMLNAEAKRLSNQARFIMEKCNKEVVVENKKRKVIVEELIQRKYDPDPVQTWKLSIKAEEDEEEGASNQTMEDDEEDEGSSGVSKKAVDPEKEFQNLSDVKKFDYLLGMSMWMLTDERKNELLKQRDAKLSELKALQKKSKSDLWKDDLETFIEKLDQLEEKERREEAATGKKETKKAGGGKKKINLQETMPSPAGKRVEPLISDDLKKRIQTAVKSKENKGKRGAKKINIADGEDEADDIDGLLKKKTLKDKLGTPEDAEKKGRKKVTKGDGLKQSKLNFAKKSPANGKANGSPKKRGKKHSFSDESGDEDSLSGSDVEFSSVKSPAIKERATSRRAATKVLKYKDGLSSASSSDDGQDVLHENDAVTEKSTDRMVIHDSSASENEEASAPPTSQHETSEDLFDSLVGRKKSYEMDEDEPPKAVEAEPTKVVEAVKKAAPKRKKQTTDNSDSDMFADEREKKKPAKKKTKAAAKNEDGEKKVSKKTTSTKKIVISDDEDEDDDDFDLPKKKGGKKAAKLSSDDEDFSPPIKASRPGRGAAAKSKYVFDSDNSSD